MVDLSWLGLRWIQEVIVIVFIRVAIIRRVLWCNLLDLSGASSSSQGTSIIDTPSQDLVVMCKCSAMHPTHGHLNNTNVLRREIVIDTRSCNVDRFLAIISDSAESKLTRSALTEDENVELLGRTSVDLGNGFLRRRSFLRSRCLLWS